MPNIDNLNFKVIIDDSQFNRKIEAMKAIARQFNTDLTNLLNVQAVSQELVVANRKRNQMETDNVRALEQQNRERMKSEALQKRLNTQVDKTTKSYQSQSRILQELRGYALGYLSVHGVSQLLSSLLRVTGEFELQKTTLAAMLGDLNKAEIITSRIKALAVESPFQFKELTTYAKQLSAFSIPAEELFETTKMLADVSAGLGVGMDRLILAYGQVRSAAFLRGQEVRQFTEAGIPILNLLAKQFEELEGRAVSTGEVFDRISKRLVPFEMVAKAFKDMTSEGGKFYNMQQVQADTLRGKISNLKDAYEIMLNEIGEGQSENLKGAVDTAKSLMLNYEETGRTLVSLVTSYGIYKAALIAIEVVTNSFVLANHKLLKTFANIGKWVATNPYAMLAAGIGAMGGLIYKAATDQSFFEQSMGIANETLEDYNSNLSAEKNMLGYLLQRLSKLTEGTDEYNRIKSEILRNYSPYLDEVDKEKLAIGELTGMYEKLAEKITEAQKQKFLAEGTEKLSRQYSKGYDRIFKQFNTTIKALQIQDKSIKRSLADFVRGDIGLDDLPEQAKKAVAEAQEKIKATYGPGGQFGSGITFAGFDFEVLRQNLQSVKDDIEAARRELENELGVLYGDMPNRAADVTQNNINSREDAIKALEKEIKTLQILKKEFDQWRELGVDETSIATYLEGFFPNIKKAYGENFISNLDYATRLLNKIEQLERLDPEKAYEFMTSIGVNKSDLEQQALKERIKAYEDMASAAGKYYETLRKWATEDFNLDGEGVMLDVSKIVSDLNTKFSEIDLKAKKVKETFAQIGLDENGKIPVEAIATVKAEFEKKFGVGSWDTFYQEYISKGINAIDILAEKEKQYEQKLAEERARDLAKKYVSEKMIEMNIDLTDFDTKTVSQIQSQLDRLKDLSAETQSKINTLKLDGITEEEQLAINALENALKLLDVKIDDTGVALEEKIFDQFKNGISAVSEMAGKVAELGKAIGSDELAHFGEQFSSAAEGVSKIAEAAKAKDTIALIANLISLYIESITAVFSEAYQNQVALNEATKEYNEILRDTRRESHSGIFGTDELAVAAENTKILQEATENYSKELEKLNKVELKRVKGYLPGSSSFMKLSVSQMLESISKQGGWDIYRENGELNLDAIEAYFDSYKKQLTRKQRQLVQDVIDSGRAMEDAAAQQAQYLTDLFSGVADNIASSMVDAFVRSGDAAADMSDIVSDIAKSMVADLVKSIYVTPVLEELTKTYQNIDKQAGLSMEQNTEAKLSALASAIEAIQGKSSAITSTLEKFDQYFVGEETAATLGEGIKGITEETAGLLASYLNAIRADISYSKTIWERMDVTTQQIASLLAGFSAPNLMEYQQQIAANTFDTAMHTKDILDELRSVIGSDGGFTGIRTIS